MGKKTLHIYIYVYTYIYACICSISIMACHGVIMKRCFMCGTVIEVTGGCCSHRAINAKLWYFSCLQYQRVVAQAVILPTIWDAMTFMWHHSLLWNIQIKNCKSKLNVIYIYIYAKYVLTIGYHESNVLEIVLTDYVAGHMMTIWLTEFIVEVCNIV